MSSLQLLAEYALFLGVSTDRPPHASHWLGRSRNLRHDAASRVGILTNSSRCLVAAVCG